MKKVHPILKIALILVFMFPQIVLSQENWLPNDSAWMNQDVPKADVSARIGAWDPETGTGLIAVEYIYPDSYYQIDSKEFFTLKPEPVKGVTYGSVLKPKPKYIDGEAKYFDRTTILLEFSSDNQPKNITLQALYQICDEEGVCLLPDSQVVDVSFSPTPVQPDKLVMDIQDWNASNVNTANTIKATTGSLWLYLLLAFLGGILMNFMPCVLPLLSVKALGLVNQSGDNRKSILSHAWLYVAGIEVSFWIIAAIIIGLQASGRLLGWGFQFQSPIFVSMLIAVIWVFTLSLFDVFVIEAPKVGIKNTSGYMGSFLTGIFAVIIATPCTAPLFGATIGFAFSQPPYVIIATLSMAGLGLGLPFLLMGFYPGIMKKLPKAGAWMVTFRQFMGFLLFGTVLYLITTFISLSPQAITALLMLLLLLAFCAWLLGKSRNPMRKRGVRWMGQSAAIFASIFGVILFLSFLNSAPTNTTSSVSPGKEHTIPFEEVSFLQLIESDKPVFLEFTAQWCTTCKINQISLNNKKVVNLMETKQITHVVADLTSYNENLTRWLAKFNRAGLPLYVLYQPGQEPYIFPEILSVRMLVKQFSSL